MNRHNKIVRAFGDSFAGSLEAAMGIRRKCYWCQDNAYDKHEYEHIGIVDVCTDCKRHSLTFKDKALTLLRAVWNK